MARSKADRCLAPWVFVLSGVVFNILSAVITHYFIGLNTDEINRIDLEINNKQVLIDSLWQSRTELERKQEFFILLLALGQAAQASLIESINSTYFEILTLKETKMPLERDNSRLFSIAIFLQVIGLILVLARDLRRH